MGAIYSIINKENGKIYVGLSKNPQKRKNEHFRKLKKQIPHNIHLQRAWNKYGADAFEFNILENCPNEKLGDNEKWWINCYFDSTNRDKGYNIEKGGFSKSHISDETRKRMSENNHMKGKTGKNSPRYGYRHTPETIEKIRNAKLGKSQIEEDGGLWFIENMASTGITKNELGRCMGLSGDAIDSYLSARGKEWSQYSPNICIKNNSCRKILLDLGGIDFLKECIRKCMSQRQIAKEYGLGTKGVIYRYLNSLDTTWSVLKEEVMEDGQCSLI